MQKSNSLKPVHKHVFITTVALVVVCLFAFVIYPKIVLQKGGGLATPTGFLAEPGEGEVSLSWDRPSSPPGETGDINVVTGYRIYYKLAQRGALEEYTDVDASSFAYTVTGLENDTAYSFALTALSNMIESERTATETVTTTGTGKGDGGGVDVDPGDQLPITISQEPIVETGSTRATITWATSVSGTSVVYYGPTEDFSGNTPDEGAEKTTNHYVEINGLTPCAGYWYKVVSYDDYSNYTESQGGEFKTTGCKGSSEIVTYQASKATTLSGTTVEAKVSGRGITALVPANLKNGVAEVAVEALKLEKELVKSEISTPTSKEWVGNAYSLKVFQDEKTELEETFDSPVEVTIDYTAQDIQGINPSTLKIYHYTDGIGWEALSNCVVNSSAMTVTCETTSFSIFGLFGEGTTSDYGFSGGGSATPSNNTTSPVAVVKPTTTKPADVPITTTTNGTFSQNLSLGQKNSSVKALQMFLNAKGFVVATMGAGSPGYETDYFGPLTFAALVKFQEAYKAQILTPFGLTVGTGFFGEKTRALINSMQ